MTSLQWCRSLLSIGGDNLQFYPNFARFSTLGGMNLNHDLFQVSKSNEDQKKGLHQKLKSFFPRNHVKTTKKVLTSFSAQMQTTVKPELGTCTVSLRRNYFTCDSTSTATIFNGCADACAANILAILSAIAQAQFK